MGVFFFSKDNEKMLYYKYVIIYFTVNIENVLPLVDRKKLVMLADVYLLQIRRWSEI